MQVFIAIVASIVIVSLVTFAYIWARAGNKKVGGKASLEKGDCHGCCDFDCEKEGKL